MYSRSEEILREALDKAKKTIKEQEAVLQQLLAGPTMRGYVVSTYYGKVLVSLPGTGVVEVETPYHDVNGKKLIDKVRDGAVVRLVMEPAPAIIDVLEGHIDYTGDLVIASKEGAHNEVEIEIQGSSRIVRYGLSVKKPEVGDRLIVDGNACVVLRNMGPDESKFSVSADTGVAWDQIGGLADAKATLKEAIEMPFKHPALYKKYNKKPLKGVLLYGPPGCGKTMLAKAAATSLSEIHKKTFSDTGFIYVKGPEMLDKFVGNTEAQVRGLFARARKHQKKNGYPAVIFIDEADALLGKRGSRPNMGIESTVVPQFLSEMDGLDTTGAIVLLATNRPESLDSAVTRDGRVDRKVLVTRPNLKGAEDIFRLYLKSVPIGNNLGLEEVAELAADYIFQPIHKFYELRTSGNSSTGFYLRDMINGAMIASVVDMATTSALRREINGDGESGIMVEDIHRAVDSIYTQNLHLNHEEEVQEFVDLHQISVKEIVKAQHAL